MYFQKIVICKRNFLNVEVCASQCVHVFLLYIFEYLLDLFDSKNFSKEIISQVFFFNSNTSFYVIRISKYKPVICCIMVYLNDFILYVLDCLCNKIILTLTGVLPWFN